MKNKIKRIINCVVPITVCNFKCHYCYLGQTNSFDTNIPKLEYSVEHKDDIKLKFILSLNYDAPEKSLKNSFIHYNKYYKKIIRHDKLPVLNQYDRILNVDIIVVFDILNYEKIKKMVNKKISKKMILVTEI